LKLKLLKNSKGFETGKGTD